MIFFCSLSSLDHPLNRIIKKNNKTFLIRHPNNNNNNNYNYNLKTTV